MAATYCSQFNELAAASDIDLSTSSAEVSPEACKVNIAVMSTNLAIECAFPP